MEQIIISVSFAIVALVASLLLFDAANKVGPSKRSKTYRIVAGAILALMAACEYLIFGDIPAENNKEVVLTVKEDSPTNTEPEKPLDLEESLAEFGRIATLRKTKEWQNFSAFWRKLDYSAFASDYTSNKIAYHELTAEKIRAIDDLNKLPSSLISYDEISLLDQIAEIRISGRLESSMITSRMFVDEIDYVDRDINIVAYNLEEKIAVAKELREKGAINSDEFKEALEIIKEDIKIAILLDKIADAYPIYRGKAVYYMENTQNEPHEPNIQTVENHIAEIGKNYSQYSSQKEVDPYVMMDQNSQTAASDQQMLDSYRKQEFEAMKGKMTKINEVYPVFSELIDSLEGQKNE